MFAMFHLDYLSCLLTVLATILLARKSWIGLLVAIFNSLIVCAIGLRTPQQLYSSEPILHLCIHIQHATVALGTNRDKIEITRSAFERLGCSKPGAARRTADAASSRKAVLQDVPAVD